MSFVAPEERAHRAAVDQRLAAAAAAAARHFLAADVPDVPLQPHAWFASLTGLTGRGTAPPVSVGGLSAQALYQWAAQVIHQIPKADAEEQLYKPSTDDPVTDDEKAGDIDYIQGAFFGSEAKTVGSTDIRIPRDLQGWITSIASPIIALITNQGNVTAKSLYEWAMQSALHGSVSEASAQEQLYKTWTSASRNTGADAPAYIQAAVLGRKDADAGAGTAWVPNTLVDWATASADRISTALENLSDKAWGWIATNLDAAYRSALNVLTTWIGDATDVLKKIKDSLFGAGRDAVGWLRQQGSEVLKLVWGSAGSAVGWLRTQGSEIASLVWGAGKTVAQWFVDNAANVLAGLRASLSQAGLAAFNWVLNLPSGITGALRKLGVWLGTGTVAGKIRDAIWGAGSSAVQWLSGQSLAIAKAAWRTARGRLAGEQLVAYRSSGVYPANAPEAGMLAYIWAALFGDRQAGRRADNARFYRPTQWFDLAGDIWSGLISVANSAAKWLNDLFANTQATVDRLVAWLGTATNVGTKIVETVFGAGNTALTWLGGQGVRILNSVWRWTRGRNAQAIVVAAKSTAYTGTEGEAGARDYLWATLFGDVRITTGAWGTRRPYRPAYSDLASGVGAALAGAANTVWKWLAALPARAAGALDAVGKWLGDLLDAFRPPVSGLVAGGANTAVTDYRSRTEGTLLKWLTDNVVTLINRAGDSAITTIRGALDALFGSGGSEEGANKALSNLASVAINTALLWGSGTSSLAIPSGSHGIAFRTATTSPAQAGGARITLKRTADFLDLYGAGTTSMLRLANRWLGYGANTRVLDFTGAELKIDRPLIWPTTGNQVPGNTQVGIGHTATDLYLKVPNLADFFSFQVQGTERIKLSATGIQVSSVSGRPTVNGQIRLHGNDLKVFTGGGVKNLSDIGTGGSTAAAGANTALSNLASVLINTGLRFANPATALAAGQYGFDLSGNALRAHFGSTSLGAFHVLGRNAGGSEVYQFAVHRHIFTMYGGGTQALDTNGQFRIAGTQAAPTDFEFWTGGGLLNLTTVRTLLARLGGIAGLGSANPAAAQSGHVLTVEDAGSGTTPRYRAAWKAAAAAGANQRLSNLLGTSLNRALLFPAAYPAAGDTTTGNANAREALAVPAGRSGIGYHAGGNVHIATGGTVNDGIWFRRRTAGQTAFQNQLTIFRQKILLYYTAALNQAPNANGQIGLGRTGDILVHLGRRARNAQPAQRVRPRARRDQGRRRAHGRGRRSPVLLGRRDPHGEGAVGPRRSGRSRRDERPLPAAGRRLARAELGGGSCRHGRRRRHRHPRRRRQGEPACGRHPVQGRFVLAAAPGRLRQRRPLFAAGLRRRIRPLGDAPAGRPLARAGRGGLRCFCAGRHCLPGRIKLAAPPARTGRAGADGKLGRDGQRAGLGRGAIRRRGNDADGARGQPAHARPCLRSGKRNGIVGERHGHAHIARRVRRRARARRRLDRRKSAQMPDRRPARRQSPIPNLRRLGERQPRRPRAGPTQATASRRPSCATPSARHRLPDRASCPSQSRCTTPRFFAAHSWSQTAPNNSLGWLVWELGDPNDDDYSLFALRYSSRIRSSGGGRVILGVLHTSAAPTRGSQADAAYGDEDGTLGLSGTGTSKRLWAKARGVWFYWSLVNR